MTTSYEIYLLLRSSSPLGISAMHQQLGGRRKSIADVVQQLVRCGKLKVQHLDKRDRRRGFYSLIPGTIILPDGRGTSPGSARGREVGRGSKHKAGLAVCIQVRREIIRKPAPQTELEKCWGWRAPIHGLSNIDAMPNLCDNASAGDSARPEFDHAA